MFSLLFTSFYVFLILDVFKPFYKSKSLYKSLFQINFMDFTSIQTPESSKQLDGDLISAFRKYHGVRKGYFRNKNLDKIKPQAEVFKYFFIMETLLKQLAAKMVKHSRTIARDISDQAAKNPEASSEALQKLNDLDRGLAELEMHSSRQIQMASTLRRMARQSRNVIRGAHTNTARRVEVMKRTTQQQQPTAKQQEQPQYSKKHEADKRRRLEQWKRMEE